MTKPNHDEAGQVPPTRAKRTRGEPKLYISFLPEGRGGPREDKGSVPLEVDVEAHIEERTDCEPGLYRIEKKRSGEFSGEVLFYSKDDADIPAAAIGTFDDADDRMGVETGDVDIRRIVAATVSATLEARERRDRATSQPPDPMQQFREMRELLKEERDSGTPNQQDPIAMFERLAELQRKLTPPPPEPVDSLSAEDRAQLMLVKESGLIPAFMRSMREMLQAPESVNEPKGFVEKALEYASGWTPYIAPVLAPVVGQKIGEVVSRVNADAIAQRMTKHGGTPAAASNSPDVTPSQAETSAPANATTSQAQAALSERETAVLEVVVTQMRGYEEDEGAERLDERVATAAAALSSLPGDTISLLVSTPIAFLLSYVSQLKPEWADVADLADAGGFLAALRSALLCGPSNEPAANVESEVVIDVSAVAPAKNGTKPAEVATT